MKINPDFSIKLSFTRFTDDLDDWGDLSPGAVTIGEDDDTIVYTSVISGPSKGTVEIGDPNVFQHPIYYFGNRGDGTKEELCSIGINKNGSDYIIGMFGSANSTRWAIYAESSSGIGVYAKSSSSYGLYAYSATNHAIYAVSEAGVGYAAISAVNTDGGYAGIFRYGVRVYAADVGAMPYLLLDQTTPSDADGERESEIRFKGTQSGCEVTTLAIIQACHDGAVDDEKGKLRFMVNDGNDVDSPTEQATIDAAGILSTKNHYPKTDNVYFLGKNDDDTPFAWKGVILKDQGGTGKYYRLEVNGDALQIVDLTD